MAEGKAMSEFLPFSRPAMGVEELAAVKEVLESGWLTTGPKNQALEQAFCQLTGNQHAIAVSSATAGMHITLMALEIGKGDEVITPSLVPIISLPVITYVGPMSMARAACCVVWTAIKTRATSFIRSAMSRLRKACSRSANWKMFPLHFRITDDTWGIQVHAHD